MKKIKDTSSPSISRRNFINIVWTATGTISVLSILGVCASFIRDSFFLSQENENKIVVLGPLKYFAPSSVTLIRDAGCFVFCNQDGGLLALSNKCTHLGCAINWDENKQQFICPCHASTYTIKGDVIHSPAPRALDLYPINVTDGIVYANTALPKRRNSYSPNQLFFADQG